jgi:hypothetical protein
MFDLPTFPMSLSILLSTFISSVKGIEHVYYNMSQLFSPYEGGGAMV